MIHVIIPPEYEADEMTHLKFNSDKEAENELLKIYPNGADRSGLIIIDGYELSVSIKEITVVSSYDLRKK
ncbi:MAG: hypothetical protein V3V00_15700 [Saprospiraceae bacterium]